MSGMYDYLDWRGDIGFKADPLGEVDALILAWLSYYEFEKLEGQNLLGMTVSSLTKLHESTFGEIVKPAALKGIIPGVSATYLLKSLSTSDRYKDVVLQDFKAINDHENSIQFSASSFLLPSGEEVVAFRGTDTSVAGWKEDCQLSYSESVPAQKYAQEYLNYRKQYSDRIIVAGHSKGGNLALYATMLGEPDLADRIVNIYNFDGPGFCFDIKQTQNYAALAPKVMTFIPQSSIVGILLEHADEYQVVDSTMASILQHDAFFWKVLGKKLVTLEKRSFSSEMIDSILVDWLAKLSFEDRKDFIETLFAVFENAGIKYFTDLQTESFSKIRAIISEMSNIEPEKRKMVLSFIMELMKSSGSNVFTTITAAPVNTIKSATSKLTGLFKRGTT